MLNPRVGLMVSMASPINFFITVVFPALSSPSTRIRISFSACLIFFNIVSKPISLFFQRQRSLLATGGCCCHQPPSFPTAAWCPPFALCHPFVECWRGVEITSFMPPVLLFTLPAHHLPTSARDLRDCHREVGETLALSLASTLTGLPLQTLSWKRATPISKPHVYAAGSSLPVSSVNLTHDGAYIAIAFSPNPHDPSGGVGVDLLRVSRVRRVIEGMGCGGTSLILGTTMGGTVAGTPMPSPPTLSTDPALLFAFRWTLMEAVLKARGEGLAVEGAGVRVLREAREGGGLGVGVEGGSSGTTHSFPSLWGATIPDEGSAQEGVSRACEVALQGYREGRVGLPNTVLGVHQGEGWASTTFLVQQSGEDVVITVAELVS